MVFLFPAVSRCAGVSVTYVLIRSRRRQLALRAGNKNPGAETARLSAVRRRCLGHVCLDTLPASTARLPCRKQKSRRGMPLPATKTPMPRIHRAPGALVHPPPPKTGGAGRDRTDDLRLAKPMLSRLSYSPKQSLNSQRTWWLIESEQRAGKQSLKEVIQPQVPLRLPCYDFTPIIGPTVDGCLPIKGLAYRLRVKPTFVV